ncbi:MAG: RagB/SusD family nutrient uptake outer membrane protein [Bacteroidaceae bacterium]|nr:RagB/SusD family nutrient uptake outer membrane protein [Bacteroidaceae bacterium]
MKKIKNRILSAVALAVAGFGFSSCDIDLLPLNEVVYENFWTNKDDVESVVTACYGAFQTRDVVERMIVWGEDRSDNVQAGQDQSEDLRFLLKGSIKTTNGFCEWSPLYKVINYCNIAMYEAPQVMQKDPNYTESDYRVNKAECSFIRDYCYLTLIKTFRDVPFTFEPSLDDTQTYRLPQTKFEVVLDSLIKDIEACKDYAPLRNTNQTLKAGVDNTQNTGKVTRPAMYALLAELYLWRASDYNLSKDKQNEYYRKCIDCCDWVLAYKMQRYDEGDVKEDIDQEVYKDYGYPLLAEEVSVGHNENGPAATNAIFGTGASFETLFEITYYNSALNRSYGSNAAVKNQYGESSRTQNVKAAEDLFETKPNSTDNYSDTRLFSVPSDYRSIASFYYNEESGVSSIYKYMIERNRAGASSSTEYGSVGSSFTAARSSQSYRNTEPNWILYRLTEVMLFRAEAEIELAFNLDASEKEAEGENAEGEQGEQDGEGTGSEAGSKMRKASVLVRGNSLTTADELKLDAFNLISAVYRRSNPVVQTKKQYAPEQPQTYDSFHKLLMNERRREFLFEGKRFYDLVRASRRAGNTQEMRQALATKYSEAGPAVAIKLIQMGFMYMPVARKEMKINPALVQNESYLDEDENKKQ